MRAQNSSDVGLKTGPGSASNLWLSNLTIFALEYDAKGSRSGSAPRARSSGSTRSVRSMELEIPSSTSLEPLACNQHASVRDQQGQADFFRPDANGPTIFWSTILVSPDLMENRSLSGLLTPSRSLIGIPCSAEQIEVLPQYLQSKDQSSAECQCMQQSQSAP